MVRCAIEVQKSMAQRNAKLGDHRRIDFRVGIHLGDVIVQADGDLMGDGVNIAAQLEGIAKPGTICLSEDAYRQVRAKISAEFTDLGDKEFKTIARPMRVYVAQGSRDHQDANTRRLRPSPGSTSPRVPFLCPASLDRGSSLRQYRRRSGAGLFRRWRYREPDYGFVTRRRKFRHRPQHGLHVQRQGRSISSRSGADSACVMSSKARCSAAATVCVSSAAHRCRNRQPPMGRALRQAGGRSSSTCRTRLSRASRANWAHS